jgi:cell division protein FtsI (penicillin-binding protein 3)
VKASIKTPFIARESSTAQHILRLRMVLGFLVLAAVGLVARAVQLQLVDSSFLLEQGDQRYMRVHTVTASRGAITDRFGEPLAISTPVDSVWTNPKELSQAMERLPQLAKALNRNRDALARRISSSGDLPFVYLARHLQPAQAARVKALKIPGVYLQREYRRYYPAGEVTGHVLGFANVEDEGQEGLELAYNHWLAGENGSKRVIQDRLGQVFENVESIREAKPGKDLVLSLDLRIQYLAYRELKRALIDNRARAGTLVMLDVQTGEVLAMVNQPAFNPNDRSQLEVERYRNRAVTDMFEPGSSIKPFVVAAALASGDYNPDSIIDVPKSIVVGRRVLADDHPVGRASLTTIIAKSSNVAMSLVASSLEREDIWKTLDGFGFGKVSTSEFPGESAGILTGYSHWRPVGISSISRGYGMSVTALQLAHAYAILGANGFARPITFRRRDVADAAGVVRTPRDDAQGAQAIDPAVARALVHMLESVVSSEGTGKRAALTGYRVAGKTGTAQIAEGGGYSEDRYRATFAGVAPASRPRLACVVMIDDPGGKQYHGGEVAAPVFAAVMAGALRLMAVPPDDVPAEEEQPQSGAMAGATVAHARVRP